MSGSTIIVGGGIGGFTVAQKLRDGGYPGVVTIIDPEGIPYDRPPLSKGVLTGRTAPSQTYFVPESWYPDNDVLVMTDSVLRVDAEEQVLHLAGGDVVHFDNLVLATGGRARRGSTPGFENPELIVLRTLDDAALLRDTLQPGCRLGIVGAGLIGAEVASSARELGVEVVLIDPAPVSLIPAVGEELANRLHSLHETHGVTFINGLTTGIEKQADSFTIHVDGHDSVTVDTVLLCIGITPDEILAASAGLARDNGILVDDQQRTSVPGIWAAGDCARRRNDDGSLERRHEHWDSALQEGAAAAASILGAPAPSGSASWFWSDRYAVHVEGTGDMSEEGTTIIRTDDAGAPAVAFRLRADGTLAGAASYNDPLAIRACRRIIDRGLVVDPSQLADKSVPLKKLTR